MAKTIPQLTDATTVNAADELIISQSGITKRATATELAAGIDANVHNVGSVGMHATDNPPGNIWRFKDRLFVGDAADFTGNQATGSSYGSSWAMQQAATYFYLNSVVAAAGTAQTRFGAGARNIGVTGISKWMGLCGVGVNDGELMNFARGIYAEGMHFNSDPAAATVGLEVVCGNWSGTTQPIAHAYSMESSQCNGIMIAPIPEGYRQGSVAPGELVNIGTHGNGAAIDISGGATKPQQGWAVGIVVRSSALNTTTIGNTSNVGIVMSMPMNHQLNWLTGSRGTIGAFIRCNTTVPQQCSGLVLKSRGAAFVGADYERIVCDFQDDTAADRATSSIVGDGTTATAITTGAHGLTTGNVVFINDCTPNGFVGRHTVTVVDATTFTFPSAINATATVQGTVIRTQPRNYLQVRNSRTLIAPAIAALGDDTNVDINFVPKGTGRVSYGTWVSGADAAVNGYIEIRDASGNVRKLATIA